MAAPGEGTAAVSFVGRDRELARVVGLLEEARAGRGRLLLCMGEAGIGKARLAEETAALAAARGAAVANRLGRWPGGREAITLMWRAARQPSCRRPRPGIAR